MSIFHEVKSGASVCCGLRRLVLLAGLLMLAPAHLLHGPCVAEAQNSGQRIVSGAVVNDAGTLLPGATVFLEDLKTKAVRSYTTPSDGSFRFTQVSMAADQQVWAEKDGKKSAVKAVSSWDTRKQFICELKLK